MRQQVDHDRPGIMYNRDKGRYHIRILDPRTNQRLYVGSAASLREAQRKWDAAKKKLEMSANHG